MERESEQEIQPEPIVKPYVEESQPIPPVKPLTIEEAVFGTPLNKPFENPVEEEPEPIVEEEPVDMPRDFLDIEEPIEEQESDISGVTIDDSEKDKQPHMDEYIPHNVESRFIDEEEEDKDEPGVTISYDDDDEY